MSQNRSENTPGKRNNPTSLQTRLVLFVLFTALIPLIITSALNSNQTQRALTNAAEISLRSAAQQTANSLDTFITTTLNSIRVESQLTDFSTYMALSPTLRAVNSRQTRAKDLLDKLSQKDPENIISYALINVGGTVLLDSQESNVQKNESLDEYFTRARISDQPIVTAVTYIDEKTASIVFANNLYNKDGVRIGILRIKYNSDILQQVISNSVGKTSDVSVILLDQFNIRMADTQNPEFILKSIVPLNTVDYSIAVSTRRFLNAPGEEQATNLPEFAAALQNAKETPFFTTDINPNLSGEDSIAVAFLQNQAWSVAYSRPTSIFLADVQRQNQNNILIVISASILVIIVAALIARAFSNPIIALAKVADSISQGDLNARANINTTDEIGVLASAFNSMTNQLQSTLVGLEQRINERTADLQKTTLKMETIADVTREIAIIRDMDTLLKVSVALIRDRLKYYHVGIYLVDERGEYAILSAVSSVAAEQLLAKNYKLKVGQTGIVGKVARTGQAYTALDVSTDAFYFNNPLLPETQSEIVLPLRSHNITIGVLDIQANTPTAFDEKDTQTLQILADQLAAAIENAQLSQRVDRNLAELTIVNRLQTQQIWRAAIDQRERPAYEYDGLQVRAVPQNLPADLLKQLETGKPVILKQDTEIDDKDQQTKNTLLIPLLVLNQIIGVIGLEQEDPDRVWTDEEIALAQAAANRAALTLDNARLLEESQRRAVKERTIFESTARIGSALNIENILQTTAEELERVLGNSEVILQFQSDREQKPEK